jgi:hypothetical protein
MDVGTFDGQRIHQERGVLPEQSDSQRAHKEAGIAVNVNNRIIRPSVLGRKVSQELSPEAQSRQMNFQDTNRKKRRHRNDAFSDIGKDLAPARSHDDDNPQLIRRTQSNDIASQSSGYGYADGDDHRRSLDIEILAENHQQHRMAQPTQHLEGVKGVDASDETMTSNDNMVNKKRSRSQKMLDPFGNEDKEYGSDQRGFTQPALSAKMTHRDDRIFPGYVDRNSARQGLSRDNSYDRPLYHYEASYHCQNPLSQGRISGRLAGAGFPVVPVVAQKTFRAPPSAQKTFRAPLGLHMRSRSDEGAYDEDGFDDDEGDLGKVFVHKPRAFFSGARHTEDDLYNHDSRYAKRMKPSVDASLKGPVARDDYKTIARYKDDRNYPSDDDIGENCGRFREGLSSTTEHTFPPFKKSASRSTAMMIGGMTVATKSVNRGSPAIDDSPSHPVAIGPPVIPPLESISIISNDSQKSSKGSQNSNDDRVAAPFPHSRRRSPLQLELQSWVDESAQYDNHYSRSQPRVYDEPRLEFRQPQREALYPPEPLERYRVESPVNGDVWVEPNLVRGPSRGTSLYTFGPSESPIDFHILAMAGKTFDEGRFSSSKLIINGFDYEFREMRSKNLITPGQLGDVGMMARNIARSFHVGHSRTMRVEIVNPAELLTLGPRLTHVMMLVGVRDDEKESPDLPLQRGVGAVVTVTDGKYKGCRGILRQVNDGYAMVRLAVGDNKGKSVLIPKDYVEMMDESELLMHVGTGGRSSREVDNLLNAQMSVDSEVLQSFQSDMFDSTDDTFGVGEGRRTPKRTQAASVPHTDFMADISEHLVNSFDPELYQMMESDKMGTPRSHACSVNSVTVDSSLLSPLVNYDSDARSNRSVHGDAGGVLPLGGIASEAEGRTREHRSINSHDDETDKDSVMHEIPLPAVADLPAALSPAPEMDDDEDDEEDDALSDASVDDAEKDEEFIDSPKPKKKTVISRAPKLPLATARAPSTPPRASKLASKERPSFFKPARVRTDAASVYSDDTDSETSHSAQPTREPIRRGRGRPKKYKDRDTTSAWNFLSSLSVLELKDKLKQMKMASTGNKGKLLEKIRSALDIDRETPMAVLPDIVTQL